MAETMSIRDRIASLNLNHVSQPQSLLVSKKKPPPPPPTLPRSASTTFQPLQYESSQYGTDAIGNLPNGDSSLPTAPIRLEPKRQSPPALPSRRTSAAPAPPSLPPRRPSSNGMALQRRDSQESIASTLSVVSTTSAPSTRTPSIGGERRESLGRNLPPVFDSAALPPLPPKRPEPKKRPAVSPRQSSAAIERIPTPSVPMRRESTPATIRSATPVSNGTNGVLRPKKSALDFCLGRDTPAPQAIEAAPPPIPLASRPNLDLLMASKPRPVAINAPVASIPGVQQKVAPSQPQDKGSCLICRDFSGPDGHAARFPLSAIPSKEVSWLSHQLCSPFTSASDKARCIFSWLHHNISYNTTAFFSGVRQSGDPLTTLRTGTAVCEGYAGLFSALALAAGLECVVVGGHGKGFGFAATKAGERCPPPNPTGHAWNAVKIDNGEWKLLDPCWGAGHISDQQVYVKHFSPEQFTMSNDDFGRSHFPSNEAHFFRNDGRPSITWEEYIIGTDGPGEDVLIFSGCEEKHGFMKKGFLPKKKHISVRGLPATAARKRVQFQMTKVCPHYDPVKAGKGRPYLYVLAIGGKDGRKREEVPFKSNGQFWWLDVAAEDLGCSGQTVNCYSVNSVDGKDGRGLTQQEYERAKMSYKGMGFDGVAAWQLV